jgi:hypothetical protein
MRAMRAQMRRRIIEGTAEKAMQKAESEQTQRDPGRDPAGAGPRRRT